MIEDLSKRSNAANTTSPSIDARVSEMERCSVREERITSEPVVATTLYLSEEDEDTSPFSFEAYKTTPRPLFVEPTPNWTPSFSNNVYSSTCILVLRILLFVSILLSGRIKHNTKSHFSCCRKGKWIRLLSCHCYLLRIFPFP